MTRVSLVVGVCLLVMEVPCAFAIGFDVGTASSGSGISHTFSHAVGEGKDRALIVCALVINPSTQSIASVTYNSIAMTPVASGALTFDSGNFGSIAAFVLSNPPTGAHNVVITASGSSSLIVGLSNSYTGVHQVSSSATGKAVAAKANQHPGPVTVDVASSARELVQDCTAIERANAAPIVGGSQLRTGLAAYDDTGASGHWFGSSIETGAKTTTMSWTLAGGEKDWATVAFPIKPAS